MDRGKPIVDAYVSLKNQKKCLGREMSISRLAASQNWADKYYDDLRVYDHVSGFKFSIPIIEHMLRTYSINNYC